MLIGIRDSIKDFDVLDLIDTARQAESLTTKTDRATLEALLMARATLIGGDAPNVVRSIFDAIRQDAYDRQVVDRRAYNMALADDYEFMLERNAKGDVLPSLNNYQTIMRFDTFYKDVRYNVLKAAPEKHHVDFGVVKIDPWTDADEVSSLAHIEEKFKIYSDTKHAKALITLFSEREYNPIEDIVNNLEWDGEERICNFLTRWMKAEDSPYTREVSRLIFAGGINRLYSPGCKFDDVPVLIGTKQGEGKSTVVRWLALNDCYASEVTDFEGQEAVEQLEGSWICEVAELLALTKTKEQEAVKAFITRQSDKYRKPYAKNSSVLPRRCVFIGTTNNSQFLRDKTGNRRFYPVTVHNSGYDLFDHEEECRKYIEQCWAEAREKYKRGEMPAFADKKLIDVYRSVQESAMEDDWRVGAIKTYLDKKYLGDIVCTRQIFREAFKTSESDEHFYKDPDKRDSTEISAIMNQFTDWKKFSGSRDFDGYGSQRGWVKISGNVKEDDGLPF